MVFIPPCVVIDTFVRAWVDVVSAAWVTTYFSRRIPNAYTFGVFFALFVLQKLDPHGVNNVRTEDELVHGVACVV